MRERGRERENFYYSVITNRRYASCPDLNLLDNYIWGLFEKNINHFGTTRPNVIISNYDSQYEQEPIDAVISEILLNNLFLFCETYVHFLYWIFLFFFIFFSITWYTL